MCLSYLIQIHSHPIIKPKNDLEKTITFLTPFGEGIINEDRQITLQTCILLNAQFQNSRHFDQLDFGTCALRINYRCRYRTNYLTQCIVKNIVGHSRPCTFFACPDGLEATVSITTPVLEAMAHDPCNKAEVMYFCPEVLFT